MTGEKRKLPKLIQKLTLPCQFLTSDATDVIPSAETIPGDFQRTQGYEKDNTRVGKSGGSDRFGLTYGRTEFGSIDSVWQPIGAGGGSHHTVAPEVWRTGSQRTPEYRWTDCAKVDLQLRLTEVYADYHPEGGVVYRIEQADYGSGPPRCQ